VSQENAAIVSNLFDRFWQDGDWSIFNELDPDFLSVMQIGPEATQRGPREFEQLIRDWIGTWEDNQATYEVTDLGGEHVLLECHLTGRMPGSEARLEMDLVQLWTIRDGTPVEVGWYEAREDALAGVPGARAREVRE
jgi:ketosteroid isomerase-like protein